MRDVWLWASEGGGMNVYVLMVDGKPYDQFSSTRPLTWSEQDDVVAGYREGLGLE